MNTALSNFDSGLSVSSVSSCELPSIIPHRDADLYAALPRHIRSEFDYIESHLNFLMRAKSLRAACSQIATNINLNARQLYDRILKYLTTNDWKDLVNRAKAGAAFWKPTKTVGIPVAFQNYYKKLCEEFQRVDKGGYRELLHIWKTHQRSDRTPVDFIPGYDKWPKVDRAGRHPVGWSFKNLNRFAPDNYDSAATRVGAFAASKFRPPIFKTRVGLAICEQVEFDDHEYNVKIHFPGQPKAMRPLGFTAADRLSACLFPCFKPMLWDEEEEVKKKLTERDMMWFVIRWLTNVGYRTDKRGTDLIVELGTAAIKGVFAERIYKITNDQVRVCLPGKFNRPANKGQFAPRSKGNFKHKALLESSFGLIDNFFSALPGQVGLNRLTCPEELHGREHYFKQLLKAAESLAGRDDHAASSLKFPLLNWREFLSRGYDLYQAITTNPDHDLEGWTRLGYHATEYRLPGRDDRAASSNWQLMPPIGTDAYQQAMSQIDVASSVPSVSSCSLTRARNLSRSEVFHMEHQKALHSGEIVRLSPWNYCDLVGLENGHPVTVNQQNLFEIKAESVTLRRGDPLRYLARVGSGSSARHFQTGEKFLAFVNPWSPRVLLLCRDDGAIVGLCEQWESPCANDEQAILKQVAYQTHWEAERRHAMNERHADAAARIAHMKEHNDAVINSPKRKSEAEQKHDRQLRDYKPDAVDFVEGGDNRAASPLDEFSAEGLL